MANDILVVAEHEGGKLRRGTFEALALARRLAQSFGGHAYALVLGRGVEPLARELAARGADGVLMADHPQLETYTPDGWRLPIGAVVRDLQPEWVLMGHTYLAQDMLPLVAASFGAPVVTDVVAADVEDGKVVFQRQPYDAKFVARTIDDGPAPRFATLQTGAFPADELPEGTEALVSAARVELDPAALRRAVLEIRATGGHAVDLSAAPMIVAGGRGLGSKEKFAALVGGLAEALGAAVGASRPVIDAEWLPHEHQIGSSGQSVAPKLYVALAISGAIQHMVGVRGAQCIVAVNKDKDAPIFNEANYGIVGDVAELVPELIKAVLEAKG